jgi:hypothetical protein
VAAVAAVYSTETTTVKAVYNTRNVALNALVIFPESPTKILWTALFCKRLREKFMEQIYRANTTTPLAGMTTDAENGNP